MTVDSKPLLLDGIWPLNGSQTLDGYDHELIPILRLFGDWLLDGSQKLNGEKIANAGTQ